MASKKYERAKYTLPMKFDVTDFDLFWQKPYVSEVADVTLYEKMEEWLRNWKVNFETIGFDRTVEDLPRIKGSALVVDHQFTGNLEPHLETLKKYKGCLLVTDRTLWKILPYRVPDIVCLTGNTQIFLNPHEVVRLKDLHEGKTVFSIDEQMQQVRGTISKVIFKGDDYVYELRTRTRCIEGTQNHLFLKYVKWKPEGSYFYKKQFVWCALSDLRAGDYIVILKKLSEEGKPYQLKTKEESEVRGYWRRNDTYVKEHKRGEKIIEGYRRRKRRVWISTYKRLFRDAIKISTQTNPEFMQLIGLLLGDGYVRKNQAIWCLHETDEAREKYVRIIEKTFGKSPIKTKEALIICSKKLADLLTNLGLAIHAKKKTVPNWVFTLPKEQKLAFCRGYLDSDGTVGKHGEIAFKCASKKLIERLKMLLISMGFRTGNINKVKPRVVEFRNRGKLYRYRAKSWALTIFNRNKTRLIGSENPIYLQRMNRPISNGSDYKYRDERLHLPDYLAIDRVMSIKPLGKKPVYDFMANPAHTLFANGILTHNCNVDSSYLCISFFDRPDVRKHMHEINGVFAATTHPLTIRAFTGKRYFFQPWIGQPITNTLSAKGRLPLMSTGGNVCSLLWILSVNLHANPIGLLGVDNCFEKIEQTEYPEVPHKLLHHNPFSGEKLDKPVYLDPVYEYYATIHHAYIKYAKEKHGIETVNCSPSGIMHAPWIKDISFREFVENYS